MILFLGDDSVFLLDNEVNTENLRKHIKLSHNMLSKATTHTIGAVFTRLILHRNDRGTVSVGPDFIRLCRRYEVLNRTGPNDEESEKLRKISYCCMIGLSEDTKEIINTMNLDVELHQYYDLGALIHATSELYQCSEYIVEQHYN